MKKAVRILGSILIAWLVVSIVFHAPMSFIIPADMAIVLLVMDLVAIYFVARYFYRKASQQPALTDE